MALYSQLRTAAKKLLKLAGQNVTITRITQGTYDPETGTATTTTVTQTGLGAIFDYGTKDIDGSLIQLGDKQLILSPINSDGVEIKAPTLGDKITDSDSVVYSIVGPFKTIAPGGTVVIYDCNLRK